MSMIARMQVLEAQSAEHLQAILKSGNYTFRFDCGFSKPITVITMQTRQDFVQAITQHYFVFSVYAKITGLLGALDLKKKLAKNHPVEFWSFIALNSAVKINAEAMHVSFILC